MPEFKNGPAGGVKRPLGIYLHIPFCKRKCLYCDFLSAPATEETVGRYVDALCRQIGEEAPGYDGFFVRTVFFGGGTPSLLSAAQTERIMEGIRQHYQVSEKAEITMECNPGTLEPQKLAGYQRAGINRLSIGLQSACDAELRALGRIHSYSDFLESYEAARRAGFDNINVDLMSALPGQTPEGWMRTLHRIAGLAPEHISAYSLIIEEGTPFYERYGEEKTEIQRAQKDIFLPLPSEEEERRMYEETERILARYGYRRYEISNYAKPGRECVHNIGYWDRTDYAGFGLGAASLVENVRWKMTESLGEYLRVFSEKAPRPQAHGEAAAPGMAAGPEKIKVRQEMGRQGQRQVLTRTEQMEEFMFLGLRLTAGISVGEFRRQFGAGIRKVYGSVLDNLEREGLLVFYEDGKRIKLTRRGIDVSNYALAQFLLEE